MLMEAKRNAVLRFHDCIDGLDAVVEAQHRVPFAVGEGERVPDRLWAHSRMPAPQSRVVVGAVHFQ